MRNAEFSSNSRRRILQQSPSNANANCEKPKCDNCLPACLGLGRTICCTGPVQSRSFTRADIQRGEFMKLPSSCRALVCAASAAWFLAFGGTASATAFQVAFDPPLDLFGTAVLNLADPCLAHDGDYDTY